MMKSGTILVFICMFSFTALAKDEDLKSIYSTITNSINSAILTKKSNWEVSGSAFFNKVQTTFKDEQEGGVRTAHAELALSYFVINNLCFGLCGAYDYDHLSNQTIEQKMAGVIGKKYFGSKRWRPFIVTDYLYHTGDDFKGGELNAGAGLLYHIAGSFAVTADVKYGLFQAQNENIEKRNRYYIGIGIVNFIF
jgi:hypothetical protein